MRILYLAQRVPYPPDRGDKILTHNQIRHLARNHDLAVACLAEGNGAQDNWRQGRLRLDGQHDGLA